VATLFLPLQAAVALGVILHLALHVYRSAERVRIERIIPREGGVYEEAEPPDNLASYDIVALQPIGSLFFAGASTFEEALPDVGDALGTAVIIRLRDRDEVGSTFIRALERYAKALRATGNLLILAGLNRRVIEQLEQTDLLALIGEENVFPEQAAYAASLQRALARAEDWQAGQQVAEEEPPPRRG
jgi:SulP family sulfate permease